VKTTLPSETSNLVWAHNGTPDATRTTSSVNIPGCRFTWTALFEPLGDMVLCPKEIDKETNPAGQEHDNGADDLTDSGDRFLENVENRQNGQNNTDDIQNLTHDVIDFPTI
jgi:hypothetical protein